MKTKLLSCILLSAMALGATQAFAQKLDAPIAAKEDLLTFAGVEYEVSVDDKVYHISNAHDSMGITYFAEIVSLKQTERSGDRLTYQVTAKPAQRAESMDDPPVLGEAVTYEMVLVEQDGKLLLEEFPYPMVVSDGQIDIDRYQLVK